MDFKDMRTTDCPVQQMSQFKINLCLHTDKKLPVIKLNWSIDINSYIQLRPDINLVLNFWKLVILTDVLRQERTKLLICRLQLPIDSYSSNGCFSLLFMTDSCSPRFICQIQSSQQSIQSHHRLCSKKKENTAQEASKSRPHNYSSRQPPSSNWIQTFLAFGHMLIRVKCFIRQKRLCFHSHCYFEIFQHKKISTF